MIHDSVFSGGIGHLFVNRPVTKYKHMASRFVRKVLIGDWGWGAGETPGGFMSL
jgi:hypothetical protein